MKETTYRLMMLIGLYLGIALFLLAIVALAKNVEEIKTDPIIYGMDKHDFVYCTCTDGEGQSTTIVLEEYKT